MPQWLNPGRYADRLLAAAFTVSDEIRGPSAFANGTIFTFLDDALDAEEGMTENARDVAMYLVRLGYVVRLVEEAKRTARPLDPGITGRLEQARVEAPERRQALLDASLDESGSEMESDYLRRLYGAGNLEHYNGESEVFDELVLMVVGEELADWFQGDRFLSLSGYNANVWQIVVLKATQGATASLTEADPDARLYPWEAVREFLRFGYLLRCGDEFIGYVPERIGGGDWTP